MTGSGPSWPSQAARWVSRECTRSQAAATAVPYREVSVLVVTCGAGQAAGPASASSPPCLQGRPPGAGLARRRGPLHHPVAGTWPEVGYVEHFAWAAVDSAGVSVGGAIYVRSASDRALADIGFLITDQFQGRGLGTLLMRAIAIAVRRNGIARLCADVLADNGHARHPWLRRHHVAARGGRCRARPCRGPRPRKYGITRHGGGTGRHRGRDDGRAAVLAGLRSGDSPLNVRSG
jgi:GNAT superfamily N-acetyltransferase